MSGDVVKALDLAVGPDDPIVRCGFDDSFDTRADRLEVRIVLDETEVSIGVIKLSSGD